MKNNKIFILIYVLLVFALLDIPSNSFARDLPSYIAKVKSLGTSSVLEMGYPPAMVETAPTWIFTSANGMRVKVGIPVSEITRQSTSPVIQVIIQSLTKKKFPNEYIIVAIQWPKGSTTIRTTSLATFKTIPLGASFQSQTLQGDLGDMFFSFAPNTKILKGYGEIQVVLKEKTGNKSINLLAGSAYFHTAQQGD